ncbi:MAG: prolyl oligopeptidase family protein, partial [Planctomycetota bacterium]
MEYPVTRTGEVVDDYHGMKIADPYRWLEEIGSDETRAWIEAQNDLTFGWLSEIPARERIRERLTALWNYPRYGTPWHRGGRYFFLKNDGLQNQPVLYVQASLDGDPRALIDPNAFSKDGTIALAELGISEDGRHLAYSKSVSGSDWREWRGRDVDSGKDLPDILQWSKFSAASWTHDGEGFYYSRYAEPEEGEVLAQVNYYHKLYYHRLGTLQEEDRLVYERPDEKEWGIGSEVSADGKYLIITIWKGTDPRNRVYFQRLDDPDAETVRLLDQGDASYTFVGNDEGLFYFRTDLDAPKGRLIAIDIAHPGREHWEVLIPEGEDVLQEVRMIRDTFVARFMHHASDRLRVYALDGASREEIGLPALGSVGAITGRRYDPQAFFAFTSYLHPTTIYRYDFDRRESGVHRSPGIDFDTSPYETRQVFVESPDGTNVPMFLVHKRGIAL